MITKSITTTLGVVEIEMKGSGLPVIVLHGSPGGIDAAVAMSRFLEPDRFETICISRPGYLGTPIDSHNASIDHEADLLAAVLDELKISRAAVLAWSGGGPPAYRFAVRHPDRVSSIVAIAALSSRWIEPKQSFLDRLVQGTTFGGHLVAFLSKKAPQRVVEAALESEGSVRGEELRLLLQQVLAEPEQCRLILDIAPTVNTAGRRQPGWQNDVANYGRIDSLELQRVRCPVLLVQGDADTDVIPEYSRAAHAQLPDSVLVEMKNGSHLSFYAHPEARDVQERTRKWFVEHS